MSSRGSAWAADVFGPVFGAGTGRCHKARLNPRNVTTASIRMPVQAWREVIFMVSPCRSSWRAKTKSPRLRDAQIEGFHSWHVVSDAADGLRQRDVA
jgi:hypothetical protein